MLTVDPLHGEIQRLPVPRDGQPYRRREAELQLGREQLLNVVLPICHRRFSSLPNILRISCRPSCRGAHKLTLRSVLKGRCAWAEPGTRPAGRLHARVRRRGRYSIS